MDALALLGRECTHRNNITANLYEMDTSVEVEHSKTAQSHASFGGKKKGIPCIFWVKTHA